jgi:hypothetical protein
MIGFIVTPETSAVITAAVELAQTSRGLEPYIGIRGMEILSGPNAGQHFIPFDDLSLTTPLHGGTRIPDYPEFTSLLAMLGGLEARVDIDPLLVTPPSQFD